VGFERAISVFEQAKTVLDADRATEDKLGWCKHRKNVKYFSIQVLTTVIMKNTIFCDDTQCNPVYGTSVNFYQTSWRHIPDDSALRAIFFL
jgi:hypothetical protein